jgi:hypothetical protein
MNKPEEGLERKRTMEFSLKNFLTNAGKQFLVFSVFALFATTSFAQSNNGLNGGGRSNIATEILNQRSGAWTNSLQNASFNGTSSRLNPLLDVYSTRDGKLKWNIFLPIPGTNQYLALGSGRAARFQAGAGYWDNDFIMEDAICRLLAIPEGGYGAIAMVVSGLIAVVASAMGSYRAAMATLVVGIGCWLLYPLIQLFFGDVCINQILSIGG